MIQVVVADAGVGIPASLQNQHPRLSSPKEALEKSLWPHFSGTFEEGLTGNSQNAGMGLFFISEMTKLVAGRLVIASRGATLTLVGDSQFERRHQLTLLAQGFPGTLVAFEMPAFEEQDYDAMIETIRAHALERTPRRETHKWLRFEVPPKAASKFAIGVAVEDTVAAQKFASEILLPRITAHQPIALDFANVPVCTQSYVHALLFEPLRVAWALRTNIYVINAQPPVRSTLELLQNYALSG